MGNHLSTHQFNIPGWEIIYDNENSPRWITYGKDNRIMNITITPGWFGYELKIVEGIKTKKARCNNLREVGIYLSSMKPIHNIFS